MAGGAPGGGLLLGGADRPGKGVAGSAPGAARFAGGLAVGTADLMTKFEPVAMV